MKIIVFVAIFALASAAVEEKKANDEKIDDRRGLQWPLPDWSNEGDLILHGVHFYKRVGELRKVKNVENDVDKMVLLFGREFLRRAHKYLSKTPDFKILPILCRDSRSLNASQRWEIRIQPEQQRPETAEQDEKQNDAPQSSKQGQGQNQGQQQQQNDTPQQKEGQQQNAKQNDQQTHPKSKAKQQDDTRLQSNFTKENITELKPTVRTFESERQEFYHRMGSNFARLLMKKYRNDTLIAEETEYLDHWLDDESVHFGVMGIYCWSGDENVKEIVKLMNQYIEDKP